MAKSTSQDAFIFEEKSEIQGRTPLTEFTDDGYMHYPQIRVTFDGQLSVKEKANIAKTLKDNGINEFSIDGDYFIVSIIDFNSENYEQKKLYYDEKQDAITTLFGREGGGIGTNKTKNIQESIRKSQYVGARNEGNEQSQTREYDKRNLFEKGGINDVSVDIESGDVQFQKEDLTYDINGEKLSLNEIKNLADEITKGNMDIKRLPQEIERGRRQAGRRNVEATIISAAGEASSSEFSEKRFKNQSERLEEYAKAEGIWFEDYKTRYGEFIGKGEDCCELLSNLYL
ncbi:MAG: hypothetical protein R2771_15430 [Saprospiraceae bacterium]